MLKRLFIWYRYRPFICSAHWIITSYKLSICAVSWVCCILHGIVANDSWHIRRKLNSLLGAMQRNFINFRNRKTDDIITFREPSTLTTVASQFYCHQHHHHRAQQFQLMKNFLFFSRFKAFDCLETLLSFLYKFGNIWWSNEKKNGILLWSCMIL